MCCCPDSSLHHSLLVLGSEVGFHCKEDECDKTDENEVTAMTRRNTYVA